MVNVGSIPTHVICRKAQGDIMSFILESKNGKFNLDHLEFSKITDVFSVTNLRDTSFCLLGGDMSFALSCSHDDILTLYITYHKKLFYISGKRFEIACYSTFDNIHMYNHDGVSIFGLTIDKDIV